MNMKKIKKDIILNKVIQPLITFLLFNILLDFILLLIIQKEYMLYVAIFNIILLGISGIYYAVNKDKRLSISEILLFISHSKENEKNGINYLIRNYCVQELLNNIENINKIIKNSGWLLENIDEELILIGLKNESFIEYLKTIEYNMIEKYLNKQIKLMEFEKKDGEYKYFIKYLEKEYIIKQEKEQLKNNLLNF